MLFPHNATTDEYLAWIQWYLEEGRAKGGPELARARAWGLHGWMGDVADFVLEGMGCAFS